MQRTIQSRGTIQVFTYKEGLLSAVAHDLRLTLHRFEIDYDDEQRSISGRFYPESLAIDGAMRGPELHPGDLSAKDSRDVIDNIASKKVLDIARHPEIDFTGKAADATDDASVQIEGTLGMVGRRADVSLVLRHEGARWRGEVTLQPSRWGIKPFKALLGAIKLQDRVRLVFELPAE